MQITINTLPGKYNESPQNNPLRWVLLHQVDQGVFENTTNPFKCKDYFNDFVAHSKGHEPFDAYGMRSDVAKFDEHGGLYVLVYNITATFFDNLKVVLAPFEEKWSARVVTQTVVKEEITDPKQVLRGDIGVLWFSPECFKTTFHISTLTLFIRNCNVNHAYQSYDDIFTKQFIVESHWYPKHYEVFKAREFVLPQFEKYWCYSGEKYNSERNNMDGYTIHDNGQSCWLQRIFPPTMNDFDRQYTWQQTFPNSPAKAAKKVVAPEETADAL